MSTFRKLPSGSWNAQVRRKGEPPISKTFKTKALAEQWARSIENEMDRGLFLDRTPAERTTLAELLDRYAKEVLPDKKDQKPCLYRIKVVKKHLGHYAIAKLDSKILSRYRDARLKNLGEQSVRHELLLVSRVLNIAAKEWGFHLPHDNPTSLIKLPKLARARSRRLKDEELRTLTEVLEGNPVMLCLVQFALETGMRRGEIVSLLWKDIHIKERVAILTETKNGESRCVPLSSKAVRILGNLPRRIDGKVFGLQSDSISQAFNRACQKAGIEDLRFHDLRHEATSRFFEKGLNMMEVSSITGHKTLQMLKRYTHLKATELAQKLG